MLELDEERREKEVEIEREREREREREKKRERNTERSNLETAIRNAVKVPHFGAWQTNKKSIGRILSLSLSLAL